MGKQETSNRALVIRTIGQTTVELIEEEIVIRQYNFGDSESIICIPAFLFPRLVAQALFLMGTVEGNVQHDQIESILLAMRKAAPADPYLSVGKGRAKA